jgi:hypothetical protein
VQAKGKHSFQLSVISFSKPYLVGNMTSISISVISCPVPDQLLNGLYTPIASVYIPDDVITYQCYSEYTVTDATVSRTCNNSGLWTGNPPLCKG